ncbi:MAG: hypothetical protein KGL39_27000 [Patescibacteria group bacterium]|nr:hypothetical protein [Patescibacteria group bacterium]
MTNTVDPQGEPGTILSRLVALTVADHGNGEITDLDREVLAETLLVLLAWKEWAVLEELRALNSAEGESCCIVHHKLVERIEQLQKGREVQAKDIGISNGHT